MIVSAQELKLSLIEHLRTCCERFKGPDSRHNYIVRCPYCGDSATANHGHFNIRIDPTDNSVMVYNCFRCPAGGVVTPDVLERLGVTDSSVMDSIRVMNRNAPIRDVSKYIAQDSLLQFDYKQPDSTRYPEKIHYISTRLGRSFDEKDCRDIKVITSLKDFLDMNQIGEITVQPSIAEYLEKAYVGFLCFGNSSILFRDITGRSKYPWVKYPVIEKARGTICFYSMNAEVDPFSSDKITINMAEGVMDTLGVAYHLGEYQENHINIAVGGKFYEKIVRQMVTMGFVGDNINIQIFSDNDATFNSKAVHDTSMDTYRKVFQDRKRLFGSMHVWINAVGKDFGVTADKISPKRFKI